MRYASFLVLVLGCYESGDDDYVGDPIVEFSSAVFSAAEKQGTAVISLVRHRSTQGEVRVTISAEERSGSAFGGGVDYTFNATTVTWRDGEGGVKQFSIRLIDDGVEEGDETVVLRLASPSRGSIGDVGSATLTIRDADSGLGGAFQFSAAEYTVVGGETATVQVTRTGGAFGPASATIHATGYDPVTLQWGDGDAQTKSASYATAEGARTVDLRLEVADGAAILGTQSTAVLRVTDRAPAGGSLQFATASSSVNENEGPARMAVTRTGGAAGPASVRYAASGASGTLEWGDGDAGDRIIEIAIVDDDVRQGNRSFQVALSDATGGVLGSPATHTVTIVDNEAPAGTFQFAAARIAVSESGGSVTVTVRHGGTGAASVSYTTRDGTAGAADYVPASGVLSWAEGESGDRTFAVTITDDALDEPDETFDVILYAPVGAELTDPAEATITIGDDDAPPPSNGQFQFRLAEYRASEGSGSVTVTVQRVNGGAGSVSVTYVTNPGTASTTDYEPATGTLFWDDGDTGDRTFAVTIHNDAEVEADETVQLALQDPTGGATLAPRSAATLVIVNDDTAPTGELQFEFADYTVDESAGTATITVTRTNGSAGGARVRYEARNGTAKDPEDFDRTQGELVWADGESGPKSFTVSIANDDREEDDETVVLRIKDASGARLGALTEARLVILDDD